MNKEKALGIVRHGLTIGAGYLFGKYANGLEINVEEVVGAIITLATVAWSVFSKSKTPAA